MLKIGGFDITEDRTRLTVHAESVNGPTLAEVEVLTANGQVEVIVRRFEDDPTVNHTVAYALVEIADRLDK